MGIKVEDWPEVRVKRSPSGRVTAYAEFIRGEWVWVWVPPRYRTEGLTFFGDNVLQILPHFLRRQAE